MKSGSNLEKVLKAGHFAFTGECGPPKGANVEHLKEKLEHLRGVVDAINVTDNQTAVVRMSSGGQRPDGANGAGAQFSDGLPGPQPHRHAEPISWALTPWAFAICSASRATIRISAITPSPRMSTTSIPCSSFAW
jgi:hypothetical protein